MEGKFEDGIFVVLFDGLLEENLLGERDGDLDAGVSAKVNTESCISNY